MFDALVAPRGKSGKTMKSTSQSNPKSKRVNGLQTEYHLDYTKAKPNRFAQRTQPGSVAILLDPDVARVFQNAESVNAALRALMSTMPSRPAPTNG
jgi:hypothetical protein